MPEFRNLSGEQLIKALEKLGFAKVRQKGSHAVLRKGGIGTVVPLHKVLAIGTLKGILRQAQVEEEDLKKHL